MKCCLCIESIFNLISIDNETDLNVHNTSILCNSEYVSRTRVKFVWNRRIWRKILRMRIARTKQSQWIYENEICWFNFFSSMIFLMRIVHNNFEERKNSLTHTFAYTLVRLHHCNRCNIRFVEVRSKHSCFFVCALAFNWRPNNSPRCTIMCREWSKSANKKMNMIE